jgi:hypothetical protein
VLVEGKVDINKDFGIGYEYCVPVEDVKVMVEQSSCRSNTGHAPTCMEFKKCYFDEVLALFLYRLRVRAVKSLTFILVFGFACAATFAGGTYSRIEASFNLSGLATDPFNYEVTDVKVDILQPDSTTITLSAFFDGGITWRVRHMPTMSGTYSITNIRLNGTTAAFSNLTPTNWVITGFPAGSGYVQVDPSNPRRFLTSDGRRYFPVGENMAWSSPSANALNIFPKMGAAHENWSRVWMTHFYDGNGLGLNLDWPKVNNTFGQFSLTVASNWDAIVSSADQAGIHFQMTLQHHGQYSTAVDPNWPQNPWNTANGGFLSNATNFFTDATARGLTKRKYHYIIARWGYSPAIMAWELFNEVQFTDAAGDGNAALGQWGLVQAWHNEMSQYIRTNDPYHHLITTSSALDEPLWDKTDYYQHHEYPTDLITGLRDAQDITALQPVAPDYAGECGINTTPHVGISPPIWAGIMSGQSGAAMPWYWDTIDPNNDYFLIKAAADFVTVSGLGDQDLLTKSSPTVTGSGASALVFGLGSGFNPATQDTFTVGSTAPIGAGTAPPYLQSQNGHPGYTPNGYTFNVNYAAAGTFSVQILQIAACGATLQMFLDGVTQTNVVFQSNTNCGGSYAGTTTNVTCSINVPSGAHTVKLFDSGNDWLLLGNITLNPYVPVLGAYAVGNTNFTAMWLWHRTNVFLATPGPSVAGTVDVSGLNSGTYSATWWDTFGAGAGSNFTFTVTNATVPVTLATPPILRSMALFAGLPAQASITPPNLTQTVASGSPSFNLPLVITNSGGLPLAYTLTFTSAITAWLSFSSTNGYVSKSGAVTVYLAFNPTGLAVGTYTFTIFVNTSDPLQPVTSLPVSFTISSGIPAPPQLVFLSASGGKLVFQLLGDSGIPYVIQQSPDLLAWTSVSTNTLPGGILNITNSIASDAGAMSFWRALWHP